MRSVLHWLLRRLLPSVAVVGLVWGGPGVLAATCRDDIAASTADLQVGASGVVYQPSTGLEWKLCPHGMWPAGGNRCTGGAAALTWAEAHGFAASDSTQGGGWRMPSVKELLALAESRCHSPALDPAVFPDSPPGVYWTSTGSEDGLIAYGVDAIEGRFFASFRLYARFVRGGRLGASFDSRSSSGALNLHFPDRYWAQPAEQVDSQAYVVQGLVQTLVASIAQCGSTSCAFSVNGGAFSTEPRDVVNGDAIELRQRAAATGGLSTMRFQIGTSETTWRVYTAGQVVITTPSPLPGGAQGVPYFLPLDAANGTPPVAFDLVGGSLPPGLQLAPNGVLQGTPTTLGTFSFDVRATDASTPPTTSTRTFALTVRPRLVMLTTTLPDGVVFASYDQQILTAGGTPPVWFWTFGTPPPGLFVWPATGHITGAPQAAGLYSFSIRATDATGQTAEQGYTVRVRRPSMLIFLSVTNAPVPAGTVVTLRAMAGAHPPPPPDGNVTFRDGSTPIPGCTNLSGLGIATCTVTPSVGLHTFHADYSGGPLTLPATASVVVQVTQVAGTACAGFVDVDSASPFCASVDWIRNRGVTTGCGGASYCPDSEVTRLAMAAFMARFGAPFGLGPVNVAAAIGTLPIASPQVVCTTVALPGLPYPSSMYVDGVVSALASTIGSMSVQAVRSLDGGVTWQALATNAQRATLAAGRWANVRTMGSFDAGAGQQPRFGLSIAHDGIGSPNLADATCRLRVHTINRNPPYAPFDPPR